ncbi:MAG: NAD(P)H-dependent oxidoreductase subunit E [Elusimicrobia bacterium]|nr:NAD(P)H-dependent oxidoreductase subunit E [Elusimicrobiota bacterium]
MADNPPEAERLGPVRGELLASLHRTQEELGYIPAEAVSRIAKDLKISETDVYSVITFYKAFSLKPRGKRCVTACVGTACHVRGVSRVVDELSRTLGVAPGETTKDGEFTLETVNCLGCCAIGPVVVVDGEYHGQVTPQTAPGLVKAKAAKP